MPKPVSVLKVDATAADAPRKVAADATKGAAATIAAPATTVVQVLPRENFLSVFTEPSLLRSGIGCPLLSSAIAPDFVLL